MDGMKSLFLVVLLFCITQVFAQIPQPENGVKESVPSVIAIKNADIIVSPEKKISNGSMLIEKGRVTAVGKQILIPRDAVVYDYEGKTIVPAFIESYSNYGMPKPKAAEWSPRPQLNRKVDGPYYWNEAVKPEKGAAELFAKDGDKIKQYQKMGFGVAVTHQTDGVIRGTATAVLLSDVEYKKAVVKANCAGVFSFQKGVSRQSYPSSQMGSIALIRQALYDAKYYRENGDCTEENLSLDALNSQLGLPLIFDLNDKLEILRAQKIATEFGLNFAFLGGGNEYERINELSDLATPLILPLKFPEAYDVKDPFVARHIPLSDLKHWEMAPANPAIVQNAGLPFMLTAKGHTKSVDFWKSLHKAMERGLTREQALAALTTKPAEWFRLDDFGTLEVNKWANFSVFNKDPFESKQNELLASWSNGIPFIHKKTQDADIRGKYNILIAGDHKYPIDIVGSSSAPKAQVTTYKFIEYEDKAPTIDTIEVKVNLNVEGNDVTMHFNVDDDHFVGAITLHGKYNQKIGVMEGQGSLPNGKWVKWGAIKNEKHKGEDHDKLVISDTSFTPKTWFPNMAYGFDTLPSAKTYVLRNATVWTNENEGILKDASVIIKEGKIDFVGNGGYSIPVGAIEIDASGMHITSGIIDEHSHIAISKGVNEGGQTNSAEVSIADVVRSDDINIYRQLSGGVTAAQLLHGSANAIGGQSALIKLKWGESPEEMLIDNAPKFIKFALGENVKQSNWGDFQTIRFPQTRMGVEQVYYDAFIRARKYHNDWEKYNSLNKRQRERKGIEKPAVDLELEAVWEVMNSERFISCHSYVQSEINMLMHVADSMGFTVNTFTHILEGYKLADELREHGAGASTFSDWWAYKFEVQDAIPYNASLMNEQGVVVAINSDDAEMGRRLNQEAAKALKYGGMTEEEAWKMVTLNPAKLLRLDDRMGSLKVGKDADVVIWTDNPLSVKAKAATVFIDGVMRYDYKVDTEKQLINREERARIINEMLKDNQSGNPTRNFVKRKQLHWHCDTMGEAGSEGCNHH
jgi:imidazolonepropionase-like amidohydrolase